MSKPPLPSDFYVFILLYIIYVKNPTHHKMWHSVCCQSAVMWIYKTVPGFFRNTAHGFF